MNVAVADKGNYSKLDLSAFNLISAAQRVADYDEALFQTPDLKGQLLNIANEAISSPATVPSRRSDAYNLYAAFDHIVERGLWQEPQFAEFTDKLLNNTNPRVKEIFIDCLSRSVLNNSYYSAQLLDKNPNLLTQILDAAVTVNSETALSQTINIFGKVDFSRINQANLDKLLVAIEKNPSSEILAEAAILYANNPNQKFSDILQKNFKNLDNLEFKNQSVLRYLLNHSPSSEVVKKTIQVGLHFRTRYDDYPGATGLLESALYLKRHRFDLGVSLVGLGNLFDMITNRRLSPSNYSDEAAIRFMARNFKVAQPIEAVNFAFTALGASHNPAALDYLEKVSNVPGFLQKALNSVTLSWSNICNNHQRLSAALGGLKNNTCEQAQALRKKLSSRLDQKITINFLGW